MRDRIRWTALWLGVLGLAAPLASQNVAYEVWLSDQTNSQGFSAAAPNGTSGGFIRIYDSADLDNPSGPIDRPANLDASTIFPATVTPDGAPVVRLHGILPDPTSRVMAVSFVVSGHLGLVDGATRRGICLFRTTGTSTGRQNHMTFWDPTGSSLIIANQNGRLLERVDVSERGYVFNAAASLDLVGGPGRIVAQPWAVDLNPADGVSCSVSGLVADNQPTTTPGGLPKQAAALRPLNTVICPIVNHAGTHALVTLGGGGMFVVDIDATPMRIVGEYDNTFYRPAGCGGVQRWGAVFGRPGPIFMNAGTPGPDMSEFTVYRFTPQFPSAPSANSPNTPRPDLVFADPDNGRALPGNNRDAHGLVLTARYLHVFDRVRNVAEVFDLGDTNRRSTYSLTTTSACGRTAGATRNSDPAADLGDLSPLQNRIYVALRGPVPLTVTHAAEGSCPGLGIVTLSEGGRTGQLTHVLPTTTPNFAGTVNLSDPHAAVVRMK